MKKKNPASHGGPGDMLGPPGATLAQARAPSEKLTALTFPCAAFPPISPICLSLHRALSPPDFAFVSSIFSKGGTRP
jgi:hypothetical protein